MVQSNQGMLSKDQVHAKAVPKISPSSTAGLFRRNEKVEIIDKNGQWLKVVAPKRFTPWVQEKDCK